MLLAHEGEEFVIALPVVMLGAAFVLMKWGFGGGDSDGGRSSTPREDAVQPPHEGDAGDNPRANDQVQRASEHFAEGEHQEGEGEHAEAKKQPLDSVETVRT